jgi:hypothetical protein
LLFLLFLSLGLGGSLLSLLASFLVLTVLFSLFKLFLTLGFQGHSGVALSCQLADQVGTLRGGLALGSLGSVSGSLSSILGCFSFLRGGALS